MRIDRTPLTKKLINARWALLIPLFLLPTAALAAPSDFISSEATQAITGSAVSLRLQAPQSVSDAALCSCVKYSRLLLPELPWIASPALLNPNSIPRLGEATLFDYNEPHVGVIVQVLTDGFVIAESNFHHCQLSTRYIRWDDPHIRGYWAPVDNHMTF